MSCAPFFSHVENEPTTSADPSGLIRVLVKERGKIGHEGVIMQFGWFGCSMWVRVDFGPYPGGNIRLSYACNPDKLLRPDNDIVDVRLTDLAHDQVSLLKVRKYDSETWWPWARDCRDIARELFGDQPPARP